MVNLVGVRNLARSFDRCRRLVLLKAVERIPAAAILHYNLACYECQLGDLEVAKARLQHAISLDPACRAMALDDQDLKPLWEV
jgi:hypothetical protein